MDDSVPFNGFVMHILAVDDPFFSKVLLFISGPDGRFLPQPMAALGLRYYHAYYSLTVQQWPQSFLDAIVSFPRV